MNILSLRSWSKAQAVAISNLLGFGQTEIASHCPPSCKYTVRRTGSRRHVGFISSVILRLSKDRQIHTRLSFDIAASAFSLLSRLWPPRIAGSRGSVKTKKDHPFQSLRSWSKAQAVAISNLLGFGQTEIASHCSPSCKYTVRRTGPWRHMGLPLLSSRAESRDKETVLLRAYTNP